MDLDVIKSYLVSLGFAVDQPELAKFNDALRNVAVQVERVTTGTPFGMVSMFAKAGAAVAGILTTVAAGTVGLMDHVANADLGYQLFARRMFMTTDAAKNLKIATDALGVSLEDIVWGPKELQERFGILTGDQSRMQAGLGGDFEAQMKQIRDVRFEFTRLEVELKYLAMGVVQDLSRALFGNESSLLVELRTFNEWFIENLPKISQVISDRLVPIVKDMGTVMGDFWHIIKQINFVELANDLVIISHALTTFFDFLAAHPAAQKLILGTVGGGVLGSFIPGVGTGIGAGLGALIAGADILVDKDTGETDPAKIKELIRSMAVKMGIDPAIALAIAEKETGGKFNMSARGSKGEIGVMQLMPGTAMSMGVNPFDTEGNITGGLLYLQKLLKQYHDLNVAISHYNGSGSAARAYADDVINNRMQHYQPQSATVDHHTTIGSIDVHIAHPNATPEQIQVAVKRGVEEGLQRQDQRTLTQLSGIYA